MRASCRIRDGMLTMRYMGDIHRDRHCQVSHAPTLFRYRTCTGIAEWTIRTEPQPGLPSDGRQACGYHLPSILRDLDQHHPGRGLTFTVTRVTS